MIKRYISTLSLCLLFFVSYLPGLAQEFKNPSISDQKISEEEKIPVLVKNLPDWREKQETAVLVDNSDDLRKALGDRTVFEQVEFIQGTKAVTAEYDAGKLLIIEYNTPQTSSLIDSRIKDYLDGSDEKIPYRRIGNYNAFVFDSSDEEAANALLDQVKYQKIVQWLGKNQTVFRQKERAFIVGTMSLFISTVQMIASILGVAVVLGFIIGVIYFYRREKRFAAMDQFSDAGGMTRLNLDGFTPDIIPSKLLDK